MPSYDFSTLSSSDLEALVCNLLNAAQDDGGVPYYRLFKDGRDKGVDFLHSTDTAPYAEIGQVKHYYRTGFDGLFRHLRISEKPKIVKLNPGKYLLATSVDLTVGQTQQLQTLLAPHLKGLQDIYGKQGINQLLADHEAVLTKHFKLWFSDTAVLSKVLSAEMYYRTADFVEHELTHRMRLFVTTPVLDAARTCLEENLFVIITGDPGIGKSTLAEMLVYEKLKDDYELLYVHDKIHEAEKFIRPDDSKQLIYFDDFLGSNSEEINRAQCSESALISILRRIKHHPNKRLIFTTRVHILNKVVDESEKLERFHIRDGETVFNLEEYDTSVKEQLLCNHVDESELSDDLKSVFDEPDTVAFVVNHPGFNPRSVEYITTGKNIEAKTPDEYRKFIIDNFNDPVKIWRNAYRRQIGDAERWLLNTLLTFEGPVEIKTLEQAFNQRLDREPAQEINAFKTALIRLDGGFITIKSGKVNLRNPSIKDFLLNFLGTDRQEISRILNAVRFIQQISASLETLAKGQHLAVPQEIARDMMINFMDYTRAGHRDHDIIRLASFVQKHVQDKEKDDYLVDMIDTIGHWESLFDDYALNKSFTEFLDSTRMNYRVQDALNIRTTEIVDDLMLGETDLFKAVNLLEKLAGQFQLDFNNYDAVRITNHFDELFSEHISNEVDWLEDCATDPYEVSEKMDEVTKLEERLSLIGYEYEVNKGEFDNRDWDEITRDNDFRRLMEKDD
jgi:energy-coupling factor transporter ATP-binding protein EcfA2